MNARLWCGLAVFVLLLIVGFVWRRHAKKLRYIETIAEIQMGMDRSAVVDLLDSNSIDYKMSDQTAFSSGTVKAKVPFGIANSYYTSMVFDGDNRLAIKETFDTGFW